MAQATAWVTMSGERPITRTETVPKSGAVARACSQSRRVPTGTRKQLANSACDRLRPIRVRADQASALAPVQSLGRRVEILVVREA